VPSPSSSPPRLIRLAEQLVAWRWTLFFLGMLIVLAAYPWSRQVQFDHSIERMFAPDDPLLPAYERLKQRFGGNEVVLVVYEDPGLLAADGAGLKRLGAVSNKLKQVPGVKDVLSLAEVNALLEKISAAQALGDLFGLGKKSAQGPPLLDPNNPLGRNYLALFEDYTHSADGKTASLACMLDPAAAGNREATIAALRKVATELPDGLTPGMLAGEPVMVAEGFRLLELDGAKLGFWSTLFLGLTVFVCFRSLRWLAAPILVVQWTLIVTQASLVLLGLELSMVSSMLTAIVTVVGVATTIHLIVRTRELQQSGLSLERAFTQASVVLALPILGACLTDAAGFGSLWFASVGPVQDFGVMMAVGSLWVIPAVILLVPAAALAGESPTVKPPGVQPLSGVDRAVHSLLTSTLAGLRARSGLVAVCVVVVSVVVGLGAAWLEVETDFTNNFRPGSEIVRSYAFVEERLGGAGVWDVVLPAPERLNEDFLTKVRRLETASAGDSGARPGRPARTSPHQGYQPG
jgi:predicted RND superfamily exporter protein